VRLAPTYRLMWGIPGRSNALNIALRLGLPGDIVDAARARLGTAQACACSCRSCCVDMLCVMRPGCAECAP
jgi:hypothetical protein